MSTAVRYYSRSGNTKALAEAIAAAAGVEAVSVDAENAPLTEPADTLFIGGALYAYGIDRHMKEYLKSLKAGDAKRAVIFSTSWISKHALDLIRKGLEEAGIPAEAETFHVKNMPTEEQLKQAAAFAGKFL
ncbi:MAG: flavodoxin family protein [Lachnospiraceae bacterium]|nr:flavodoxin family protein [Lachnospiraceae bacterium]